MMGNYTGVDAGKWLEYCKQTGQPLPDWAPDYYASIKGESPHQDAIADPEPEPVCPMPEPKPRRGRRSTKTVAA